MASEVLESTLIPLGESLEMMHENLDTLQPDGEKSPDPFQTNSIDRL